MRTTRLSQDGLTSEAKRLARPEQTEKLTTMLENGWRVNKVITHQTLGSAIALDAGEGKQWHSCWLMPDGKVERPIKGKSKVSIDPNTMTRIWK